MFNSEKTLFRERENKKSFSVMGEVFFFKENNSQKVLFFKKNKHNLHLILFTVIRFHWRKIIKCRVKIKTSSVPPIFNSQLR